MQYVRTGDSRGKRVIYDRATRCPQTHGAVGVIRVDVALKLAAFDLDIAFENDAGITALFGRSGAGKSMTINLIAGLARPDRGQIELDGRTLVDTERFIFAPAHRRRVGLVFQDAQLFPHLSVRQNLLFGRWFAPKADQTIGFDRVVETLGIGHLLGRKPARLSGGKSNGWRSAGRYLPRRRSS